MAHSNLSAKINLLITQLTSDDDSQLNQLIGYVTADELTEASPVLHATDQDISYFLNFLVIYNCLFTLSSHSLLSIVNLCMYSYQ